MYRFLFLNFLHFLCIMLNTILIVVGIIFAVILIIAAFLPKNTVITESVEINNDLSTVFNFVKTINNQHQYNKWVMADPNAEFNTHGTDGTVGFILSWNSKNNNVGEGEQEILEITENKHIKIEIRFKRPFSGTSYQNITFNSNSEKSTSVEMTFESSSKYPYNLMSALMKSVLKKDMGITLNNLKNILEK